MKLNRNHFADLFRADYKTVAVTFDDTDPAYRSYGKLYTYKVAKDEDVKVGDKLLVLGNDQYKITTVREVNETPQIDGSATFDYKWALGSMNQMLARREENMARDQQLKAAVAKLEAALERRMLRKQVTDLLDELPEEEAAEFKALFGSPVAPAPSLGTEAGH